MCQTSQDWTSQQIHLKVKSCYSQIAKNPRATPLTLHGSVSMLNVKVYDSKIRKRLNEYGLLGRVARREPPHSKMSTTAQLRSAELHLNKPQAFQSNFFQTGEIRTELFGHNAEPHQTQHVCTNTSDQLSTLWCALVLHPQHLCTLQALAQTSKYHLLQKETHH